MTISILRSGWKLLFILKILQVLLLISFNSSTVQLMIPKVKVMIVITNILCAVTLLYAEISEDNTFLQLTYSSFCNFSLFTSPRYIVFILTKILLSITICYSLDNKIIHIKGYFVVCFFSHIYFNVGTFINPKLDVNIFWKSCYNI